MIFRRSFRGFLMAAALLAAAAPCPAQVEWSVQKRLKLGAAPVGLAAAADGQHIFVLSAAGDVHVFSGDGTARHTFHVGQGYDGISTGPQEDIIYLTRGADHGVEIVQVDFIRRIETAGAPSKGPEDAPAVLVVFTDFECPYCSRMAPLLDQAVEKNPGKVRLVFKNFPLRSHPFALKAATAALAAAKLGRFWEFHDLLFQNHERLDDAKISEIAAALGLDREAFGRHLQDPDIAQRIRADFQDGIDAGVRGTPTVFVNGRILRDRSPEGVQKAVEEALAKKAPVPAGSGGGEKAAR